MNIMEKSVKKEYGANKGLAAVSTILGVVVSVIVIVVCAIPVTQAAITAGNFTGNNATILGLIPTFFALSGLILVSYMVVG